MSQENSENKTPTIKAGESIITKCPICKVNFSEPVPTNMKHICPDPQCGIGFCLMIYDK